MKEQKVLITDSAKDINDYIDRGWFVANMIPMTVSTGSGTVSNGKICFLLERDK